MKRGKTIRIYLSDGTAYGIRSAELTNWTGIAYHIPKIQLHTALIEWPELRQPGVYFLLGPEEDGAKRRAYIGESEDVLKRLKEHYKAKDWWQDCIAFCSKDQYLNKAKIKYLESALCGEATLAKRYIIENDNSPTSSSLHPSERDEMEEYLDQLRVLIAALGHPILEPLVATLAAQPTTAEATQPGVKPEPIGERGAPVPSEVPRFQMKLKTLVATGFPTQEGFVVTSGSRALARNAPSMPPHFANLKDRLLGQGVLVPAGDDIEQLSFGQDYQFSSASAAASVVSGTSVNGRITWKAATGQTLKEWELSLLPAEDRQPPTFLGR